MATSAQVRSFLNAVAKKKYKKSYSSLSANKAAIIRKSAVRLAFRKKRRRR